MSTRITNSMTSRSVLADLNDVANRQAATRRQMSSGKAVNRPSDDPYAAGRALSHCRTALRLDPETPSSACPPAPVIEPIAGSGPPHHSAAG